MTQPYPQPQPGFPPPHAVAPPPKKRRVWLWVLIGVLAFFLIIGVSCAAFVGTAVNEASKAVASAEPSNYGQDEPSTSASDEPTESAADEPADEPTEEAAPKPSKAEQAYDDLSDEAQTAVGAGEDYLNTLPFSKKGLIDQLSSDYGSQFKKKDATKAVEYLEDYKGVNWKKQAVRAAKSYRETMNFSRQGLIDQLSSDYGAKFTKEQAIYGADHSR